MNLQTTHTAGPWCWRKFGEHLALSTDGRGCIIVMDFARQGTRGAQPRFGIRSSSDKGGVMRPASELDLEKHPDARLIQHAPDLLTACKAAADLLLRCDGEKMPNELKPASDEDWDAVVEQLRAAILKAEVRA